MARQYGKKEWALTGLGAAGALTIGFMAAKPLHEQSVAMNEQAVEVLQQLDNVQDKIGEYIPMSYEGEDYHIYLRGIANRVDDNNTSVTCYDFSINLQGETVTVINFASNESFRHECAPD